MTIQALTDPQKVQVRKYAGYPAYGGIPTQGFAFRFFQQSGTLEYRMNNVSPDENAEIVTQLAALRVAELAINSSADNADTSKAAVWTRNANELRERQNLYAMLRAKLLDFLGLPPGPQMARAGSSMRVI